MGGMPGSYLMREGGLGILKDQKTNSADPGSAHDQHWSVH